MSYDNGNSVMPAFTFLAAGEAKLYEERQDSAIEKR